MGDVVDTAALARITSVLVSTKVTLPIKEIAVKASCTRYCVRTVLNKLPAIYGKALVTETVIKRGQPMLTFRLRSKSEPIKERPPIVADLWRGWVNPETGIVPEKLGL